MLVGIRDAAKLVGIAVISCCAVLVCTMFLNFYLDVILIESKITSELSMAFYHAQVASAKVVCLVAGGCLLLTAVVMLLFYVKHYIDTHKKELGILKALGYSNLKIAENFWVFGLSAFFGTALGFGGAFLLMPKFYKLQNQEKLLPEIAMHFHPMLFLCLVLLPTLAFALLAIGYAWKKLRQPVLTLLRDTLQSREKIKRDPKSSDRERSFLEDLRGSIVRTKKALAFFILFSSFCFSSMLQMSFSMKDLASKMMGAMIFLIGLTLAFTTLLLAVTTVVKGNTKTIAMMRVFGYSQKECCGAILGGYRALSYVGFALGTVYQYGLLRLMVDLVFLEIAGVPDYAFDVPVMLVTLGVFVTLYEILMYVYLEKIKRISVKEIMLE